MIYACVFHKKVTKDYNDAYKWYENQKEGLGEKFLLDIRKKIEEIAANPLVYGEKGKKGYREANTDVFPFLVVYKVYEAKAEIFISSIHHTKKFPNKKYRK